MDVIPSQNVVGDERNTFKLDDRRFLYRICTDSVQSLYRKINGSENTKSGSADLRKHDKFIVRMLFLHKMYMGMNATLSGSMILDFCTEYGFQGHLTILERCFLCKLFSSESKVLYSSSRYISRGNNIRTPNQACLRRSPKPDFAFSDALSFLYRVCTDSVQNLYRFCIEIENYHD